MSEYIEREAAIEYLTLNMEWLDEDGYPVDDWDERKAHIADMVNGIPAVDARFLKPWVSVKERLPEEWFPVLGLIRFADESEPPAQQVLWYLGNGHWRETWRGDMIENDVTHWMPLPEPPEEE